MSTKPSIAQSLWTQTTKIFHTGTTFCSQENTLAPRRRCGISIMCYIYPRGHFLCDVFCEL